ncbi:MAG: hypothetical protein K5776_05210 [Lachnospiraceae bacterium]|nr:hypothetical protein [Lachnospiraceae bacterium]
MKNFKFLFILLFLTAVLMPVLNVKAEGEAVNIYTASDMQKIKDDPSGSYILMNDIDMKDEEWVPVDFTGTFDGNSHAILNLNVKETSSEIRTTYDGNYKTYDTYFAGLFGVLENAEVKNLTIRGIRVEVSKDAPCFVGSVSGYADGSKIDNCDIEGRVRLDANSKMFGTGGIVGYGGNSSITNTKADITLICIDHDAENRDEQFLGGAYSAGFIDVDKCSIKIDGYDSDHGYVHNGGLVGMYILYPLGNNYAGYINNTRVEGMITFFEDNTDRRAYCKDFMGEVMNWTYEYVGNSSDFKPNETKDYSKDLLPYYCSDSELKSETFDGSCEEFGYTLYTSEADNYSFKGDYTLKKHNITEWTDIEEATYEKEGLAKGTCTDCQSEVYMVTPVKEPEPEEEVIETVVTQEVPEVEPVEEKNDGDSNTALGVVVIAGLVISIGLVVAIMVVLSKGRKRRR